MSPQSKPTNNNERVVDLDTPTSTPCIKHIKKPPSVNSLDEFVNSPFGKMITEKSSVIYQQMIMLVNTKITQMINTGDRIQDGIYIGLANTAFALFMSGLYQLLVWIYRLFKVSSDEGGVATAIVNSEGPINMDALLQNVNQTEIEKYPYVVPLNISDNIISDYILSNQIVDRIHSSGTMICELRQNKLTVINKESVLFVPVHRYTLNGTPFYIFFIKGKLYGKHITELHHVTTELSLCAPVQTGSSRKFVIAEYSGGGAGAGYYIDGGPEGGSKIAGFTRLLGVVNQKATFDRIFFTAKPELLSWLYKFENKLMYPPALCVSNKLGVLLYGPPGTGKTGVVSAVANHLGRHIVSINSLLLDASKKNDMIKHISEAKATSIIMFDEFDYLICAKPDQDAAPEVEAGQKLADDMMDAATEADRAEIQKKYREIRSKEASSNAFDKRFLLRLLDGQGDDSDRIVFMLTNHPEKLDKDLMRPGRIDLKIELGFCTRRMFWEIVDKVYFKLLPDVLVSIDTDTTFDTTTNTTDTINTLTKEEEDESIPEPDDSATTSDDDMVVVKSEEQMNEQLNQEQMNKEQLNNKSNTIELPVKTDNSMAIAYTDTLIQYAKADFTCKDPELQKRIDHIISLNITPLVLINKLVATPGFGPLLTELEQCPLASSGYGHIKW